MMNKGDYSDMSQPLLNRDADPSQEFSGTTTSILFLKDVFRRQWKRSFILSSRFPRALVYDANAICYFQLALTIVYIEADSL